MSQGKEVSDFDLALIHLAQTTAVQPYRLLRSRPTGGQAIRLVGYGKTAEQDPAERQKRTAVTRNVGIFSRTVAIVGTPNICHNDSGTPFLAGDVIVAITSRGNRCPLDERSRSTGIRLDRNLDWIDHVAMQFGDQFIFSDVSPSAQLQPANIPEGSHLSGVFDLEAMVEVTNGVKWVGLSFWGTKPQLTDPPFTWRRLDATWYRHFNEVDITLYADDSDGHRLVHETQTWITVEKNPWHHDPSEEGTLGLDVDANGVVDMRDLWQVELLLVRRGSGPLPPAPSVLPPPFPDVDNDGALTDHDAAVLAEAIGAARLPAQMSLRGDIDGNGCINFVDFLRLGRRIGAGPLAGPPRR